ncbi:hypothetical protein EV363DRAFT_1356234 [Boletus edulis]|nr:hypothetical protein EV363DRAFT_1356234 [Boletus edulis]
MYQEDFLVQDGRPIHRTGPPITIYEEVFADIVDNLTHLSDIPDDEYVLAKTGEFVKNALDVYLCEAERESSVHALVETLLDVELRTCVPTSIPTMESDAVVEENGAIFFHVECKNELGLGGIANLQGPRILLKHITESKYARIRNKTCCPCIHLSICGPYILFGGSVLTDTYNYQLFTDYICLGGDPFLTCKIYNTAKVFSVFRSALRKLREKYEGIGCPDAIRRVHSRLFPRPAYLPNTSLPNLVFEKRFVPARFYVHSPYRTLFRAKYGGRPVLVKFSGRYNHVAHRALAGRGFAPQLHFYTQLRGGVHMVVMDFIDGLDAHSQFGKSELPGEVVKQLQEALTTLHEQNLVHGDVRRSNILVKKPSTTSPESKAIMDVDMPWHAYLMDFELAGEAKKDRYTPLLNRHIRWPPGVHAGGLMETVHDNLMLQKIIHTDT